MKKTIAFGLFSLILFTSCSSTKLHNMAENQPATYDPLQNATTQAILWGQNSAEFKAIALQTYETARRMLPLPLQDSYWTASLTQNQNAMSSLPPAIILDVDETVLDNSPFQARLILSGGTFSDSLWNEWCREAAADAIPGAVAFTNYAAEHGVTVFYLTNREHVVEEETRQNLLALGFPVPDSVDVILTKGERANWTSSKVERRNFIEQNYRVIMLFGDDLNDFLPAKDITLQERDELVAQYAHYFSRRWFILPNPVYGSWEQALFNFNYNLNDNETRQIRIERLNTKQ